MRILHGNKLYQISKVTEANESFGMTEAGKAEFERRRTEAEESCGYNIRSLDGETDFGTAQTQAEVAQWTGVCKNTVSSNLERNDGFLTLHGNKLYQISKVTEANESFGMTEAGKAEFERRRTEAEESCGYNIRSLDGETDFGTAQTKVEVTQWTGVSRYTVSSNLERNDGFLTLYGNKLYQISKVTDVILNYGKTPAGETEFESRSLSPALIEVDAIAKANTKKRKSEKSEDSESQLLKPKKAKAYAPKKKFGYNIRSLDGETDFGTAETQAEVAQWTGVSIASVSNCLQRNVRYLILNRKRIYKFSKVTGANLNFGKTPAGETEFESRSSSPALIEVDEAYAPKKNLTAYVSRQPVSVRVKVENELLREETTSTILPPRRVSVKVIVGEEQ
jgi:hypothetical protein